MCAAFRDSLPPPDFEPRGFERTVGEPSSAGEVTSPSQITPLRPPGATEGPRILELREERLVARKDVVEAGEVVIHTEVDEVPSRLELDTFREEIQVEHVPIGRTVSERTAPWEEGDELVVPVYEEQLVVVKRLILKEEVRVRRILAWEHQVFEDTVRRERLVVEEPDGAHVVREQFPMAAETRGEAASDGEPPSRSPEEGGFLGNLVRKALQ